MYTHVAQTQTQEDVLRGHIPRCTPHGAFIITHASALGLSTFISFIIPCS